MSYKTVLVALNEINRLDALIAARRPDRQA